MREITDSGKKLTAALIREARQRAGLTQKGASECLGIPIRTLCNWEYAINSPPSYLLKMVLESLAERKPGE